MGIQDFRNDSSYLASLPGQRSRPSSLQLSKASEVPERGSDLWINQGQWRQEKNSTRGRSKNNKTTSSGWTPRFSNAQIQSDTGDHHHDHQCQRRRRHGLAVTHGASIPSVPPSGARTSHSHTRDAFVNGKKNCSKLTRLVSAAPPAGGLQDRMGK